MDIAGEIQSALGRYFGGWKPQETATISLSQGNGTGGTPPTVVPVETRGTPGLYPVLSPEQETLLAACAAEGIKTAGDLKGLTLRAADGDAYRKQGQEAMQKAAIRLFGVEAGQAMAASEAYALLPAASKMSIAEKWDAAADKEAGITESAPAKRLSAPGAVAQGVTAEGNGTGGASAWDRLSDAQREQAKKMKMDETPDKKEKFAKELLGE